MARDAQVKVTFTPKVDTTELAKALVAVQEAFTAMAKAINPALAKLREFELTQLPSEHCDQIGEHGAHRWFPLVDGELTAHRCDGERIVLPPAASSASPEGNPDPNA